MPIPVSKFAELDAAQPPASGVCKLCHFLRTAEPVDAEYVRAMVAQPLHVKGHKWIASVLNKGGVTISDTAVANHREKCIDWSRE